MTIYKHLDGVSKGHFIKIFSPSPIWASLDNKKNALSHISPNEGKVIPLLISWKTLSGDAVCNSISEDGYRVRISGISSPTSKEEGENVPEIPTLNYNTNCFMQLNSGSAHNLCMNKETMRVIIPPAHGQTENEASWEWWWYVLTDSKDNIQTCVLLRGYMSACWNRWIKSGLVHVRWSHIKHWVSGTAVVVSFCLFFLHWSTLWLSLVRTHMQIHIRRLSWDFPK